MRTVFGFYGESVLDSQKGSSWDTAAFCWLLYRGELQARLNPGDWTNTFGKDGGIYI